MRVSYVSHRYGLNGSHLDSASYTEHNCTPYWAILKALAIGCNFMKGFKSTNRIWTTANTSHDSIPPLGKIINIDH